MSYTIKSENNNLAPGQPGKLEFKITGTEEDIKKIDSCEVSGLEKVAKNLDEIVGRIRGTEEDGDFQVTDGILSTANNLQPNGEAIEFTLSGVVPKVDLAVTEKSTKAIAIKIWDDTDQELGSDLEFKVHVSAKALIVEYFRLYPSIVRDEKEVKLSWKFTHANHCEIKRGDGTNVVAGPVSPAGIEKEGFVLVKGFKTGDKDEFSLRISNQELVSKEKSISREVRFLDDATWRPQGLREIVNNSWKESAIVNLVLNDYKSEENKIWALARSKEGANKDKVFLWNSYDGLEWYPCVKTIKKLTIPPDFDGDKDSYLRTELSRDVLEGDMDQKIMEYTWYDNQQSWILEKKLEVPPEFIDSPALFWHDALYLIGGSKVDIGQVSNKIERYNLTYDKQGGLSWNSPAVPAAPWPARMGHSCVVFDNKIWVIGGADENGNGLNDVWCFDGEKWTVVSPSSTKPAGLDFPSRCFFSATVHSNNHTEELWIGGGQRGYRANPVNDIWKYDGKVWEKVQTLKDDKLSFLSLDKNVKATALTSHKEKIFVLARHEKITYDWLEQQEPHSAKSETKKEVTTQPFSFSGQEFSKKTPWEPSVKKSYVLITRSFNGCIWLLAKEKSLDGVINAALHYSAPY